MQIEITLDQLQSFLDNWKPIKHRILYDLVDVLEQSLIDNVFTSHDDTVNIPTKEDLERYIKSGSNHNPPRTPVRGREYNPEYLERKRRMGEHLPHKYQEYGFWHGIDTGVRYGSVVMEAKMPETSEKDFDYLSHHEKRRSVLKLAFLRGWNDIIKTIRDRLARELKY